MSVFNIVELSLAVLGLLGLLSLLDFKWGHNFPKLTRRARALQREQRVTWHDIGHTDWQEKERSSVFKDSKPLFMSLPNDLFTDPSRKAKELDRIACWLQDDAYTTKAEEIYIVARPGRLSHEIHGLLYATVDKGASDDRPNTCAVWYLATTRDLAARARMAVCERMWRKLTAVVRDTCKPQDNATYLFFVWEPEEAPASDISDYMAHLRTFLAGESVGANGGRGMLLDFGYRAPDEKLVPCTSVEEAEEGIVLAVGAEHRHPTELLQSIYTMHFWGFTYPLELQRLEELARRARYYADLERAVAESVSDTGIPAVALDDPRAAERGFTWAPLVLEVPASDPPGDPSPASA